ncbi:guanylate kinase [Silvibacterium sp.]|uniref:guanylate kinase n=1 Tax=Silvibacterium sp. TaxID=1964179 RepID=UPI0039E2B78D
MAGILFLISAPSGSGKSSVVNRLHSLVTDLEFSISYTTRAPRGSEKDGQEYHFVTRERFEQMIAEDAFLEHAEVFGNYYGTARHSLDDAFAEGRDLLLDIDVQGARQVRERLPEVVSIFLMPPSPQVLETRLRGRSRAEGVVDEAVISRRLTNARLEIENYREYGYILVNDILDIAVEEMSAIVSSERLSRSAGPVTDEDRRLQEIAERCRQRNSEARIRPVLRAFGVVNAEAAPV